MPHLPDHAEPEILDDPVDTLRKSTKYPYGISERMLEKLHEAGIHSIRDLYEAPEGRLDQMAYVGEYRVRQLKNAVA